MSRIPLSYPQNLWSDAESVDDESLTLEQSYNTGVATSIIGNHIGTGVLPEALAQRVLFDSSLSGDLLDGKSILAQLQPSDSNLGNQLEIELSNSLAAGKKNVKVVIIGLDFESNLQYDTFIFSKNEKQISKKHYRSILSILLNDFVGAPLQSFNLGGRLVIREASPMTLSRDPVMVSQDSEPNLIFRDFFVASSGTLSSLLATSLPSYNIQALGVKTGPRQLRSLIENDVSSQIGQKFLATTNNVQKIQLLLSVQNPSDGTNLEWTGDLVISIYALQSTVQSSSDFVPNLAIDFDPSPIPLAQQSFSFATLQDTGVELDTVPQPVDFVFSNTPVGSGLLIKSDSYYMVAVKRAGSADTCQIQLATGGNTESTTRETIFNGSIWVDIPEESLWFRVLTDSAKVSDGQAYDNGHGVEIPKTQIDATTGVAEDYCLGQQSFLRNEIYSAVLQASLSQFNQIQNERTGNPVDSMQQYQPTIALLSPQQLGQISSVSQPLLLGNISDQNIKTSSVTGSSVSAKIHHYGMARNEIVLKVIDDPTDGYRYDSDLITLLADLSLGKLNEAKFIPNTSNPSEFYRIVKSELLTLMYGDVNGDGVVDNADLLAAQRLIGTDLNTFPSQDSYIIHTEEFAADGSLSWQILNSSSAVIASGTDGILTPLPSDATMANFTSATGNFNSLPGLSNYKVRILNSTVLPGNNGSFPIESLQSNTTLVIEKLLYSSDVFLQCLRADVNGDMIVSADDVGLITNYINLTSPFPPSSAPSNKIGKTFSAIRLTVEAYVDRGDNYPGTDANRSTTLHADPDIFLDGYSAWGGVNVETSPVTFSIVKQLNWQEYNILVTSNPRQVPASFSFSTGYQNFSDAQTNLNVIRSFPIASGFDPGRNDLFIPNNLILNTGGQLTTPSGNYYRVDFETNTVSFEIPAVQTFGGEKTVNLLTDFVADYTGSGQTRIGYPALRFADGSAVTMSAFSQNQVRISASVLSLSPQINGVTTEGYQGIIVDSRCLVSVDYTTGLLYLQFNNLYKDPTQVTTSTRLQIVFYLKKAGFQNTPITISDTKTANLLGLS